MSGYASSLRTSGVGEGNLVRSGPSPIASSPGKGLTNSGSSLMLFKTAMRRPTNKELDILRTLAAHPQGLYGLQVVDLSGGRIKRGSVYVYLSRLKDDNFVTVRQESPPAGYGGLPRPVYKVTGLGQRVLEAEEVYHRHLAQVTP